MKFKLKTSQSFYPSQSLHKEMIDFGYEPKDSDFDEWLAKGQTTIELNSLEELLELSKRHGELIIDGETIEIYDDCRE